MNIDLHIHTKTCSDGALPIEEVFKEAKARGIDFMSTTDHDSVDCQDKAIALAKEYQISYITGVELNVTFPYRDQSVSLDFLGYRYDKDNKELKEKLHNIAKYRVKRARRIMDNLNAEFDKEGLRRFTEEDMQKIQENVEGTFGRPHIANYLIDQEIVKDKQEAFDKYLVKCNVLKYPLALSDASRLIRNAGGVLIHAHPANPKGISLIEITHDLHEQTRIIEEQMLNYIDGVECWHSSYNARITQHYIEFARKHGLLMTGGSDCHQKPILMGTMQIPDWVAEQFSQRQINY